MKLVPTLMFLILYERPYYVFWREKMFKNVLSPPSLFLIYDYFVALSLENFIFSQNEKNFSFFYSKLHIVVMYLLNYLFIINTFSILIHSFVSFSTFQVLIHEKHRKNEIKILIFEIWFIWFCWFNNKKSYRKIIISVFYREKIEVLLKNKSKVGYFHVPDSPSHFPPIVCILTLFYRRKIISRRSRFVNWLPHKGG